MKLILTSFISFQVLANLIAIAFSYKVMRLKNTWTGLWLFPLTALTLMLYKRVQVLIQVDTMIGAHAQTFFYADTIIINSIIMTCFMLFFIKLYKYLKI